MVRATGKPTRTDSNELLPAFSRHWLVSRALVAGLALGCYVNSCWGDFVFDDSEAIINNKDVDPGASSIGEVFAHDFWGTNISLKTSHKSYRPLTVLSFQLSFWLAGGRHPFQFHLLNVLLHPVVCLLLLQVLDRWVCDCGDTMEPSDAGCSTVKKKKNNGHVSSVALITSLLFAVHPIHTESVSGVVGRAELTSALCFMAALLAYTHCCAQGKVGRVCVSMMWLSLSLTLAGCAMLFKEQGITVLGVCVVYDIVCHTKLLHSQPILQNLSWSRVREASVRVALLCAGGVVMAWGRYRVMATGAPQFKPVDNPASFADSWTTRTLSYHYVYAVNWWLLFQPWWLCFDWSMGCVPLLRSLTTDLRALAPIAFWVGLGSLAGWTICGLYRPGNRLVVLSLSVLVLPFLPASNLLFHVGFVLAERVLYLPSAGHCLLVAVGTISLAAQSPLTRKVVRVCVVYLVAVFALRSIHRSSQWMTEETLFISGAHVCPLNAKVHYNIGKVLSDAGLSTRGEEAYREAIRLYPEYDQALNNLGNLLKEFGRLVEAEIYLERAIQSNGEFAAAWMNLGIVQASLDKTKEAEASYRKAITHRRKYPDAYYNMGNLYIGSGQPSKAITAFRTAINLQSDHSNAWINLGLLYEDLKRYEEAEVVLREAIQEMPDNPRFYFSLGVLLGKTQRLQEGERFLAQAVRMKPEAANYHVNLGVVYHMEKKYDLARECYETALRLEPGLNTARENLNKLHATLTKL